MLAAEVGRFRAGLRPFEDANDLLLSKTGIS